jgi:hypothetical protein
VELVLDAPAIVAELSQHGCEGSASMLLPVLVLRIAIEMAAVVVGAPEMLGKPGELASLQLGQPAAHMELVASGPHEIEECESADGAGEGGVGAGSAAEADLGGQIGGAAQEPVGVVVERRGESTHDPGSGWTEDAEPIVFDIGRTRVVFAAVEVGFVPGKDGEEVGQCGRGHDGLRGRENDGVENDR